MRLMIKALISLIGILSSILLGGTKELVLQNGIAGYVGTTDSYMANYEFMKMGNSDEIKILYEKCES